MMAGEGAHDRLLAEKAGKTRHAAQGRSPDGHADHGDLEAAASLPPDEIHVVGFVLVDENPRAEKEKGLEAGVGGEVKDAGKVASGGKAHDHEAELADGGVG